MTDLIIKNGNCFIDDNLVSTDIAIKDKKIVKIGKNLTAFLRQVSHSWPPSSSVH